MASILRRNNTSKSIQTLDSNNTAGASDIDDDDSSHAHHDAHHHHHAPMATASTLTTTIARRHFASTAAMCLCTFTHSWLLVSVFPYSGFMVIKLVKGTDEENAGSYAGLLAASFMIGRALTSYEWGRIADTYGRRIVFFVSLVLSAVFSLLFGLSASFGAAFLWRFLLGASNGVAGISKAVVSETAQGNELLETRGMSLSMGMWAWGFLLSPAISGFLSDPIRQYPNFWGNDHQHETIYRFLEMYPFFLPNLVSVALCIVDCLAVALWVPETLPAENLRSANQLPSDCCEWLLAFVPCHHQRHETDRDNNSSNNSDLETRIHGEHFADSDPKETR